jgi:hypothetical protein
MSSFKGQFLSPRAKTHLVRFATFTSLYTPLRLV